MEEGKYCVELAKSGRSSCKRCKSSIEKDALRIGTKSKMADFESVSWTHVGCFKLPKNVTVEEFISNLSGFHDMDVLKQVEIFDSISKNAVNVGDKRKSESGSATKSKTMKMEQFGSSESNDEVFNMYSSFSIDALKDYLRWNGQVLKGTKSELVAKCVDGHKNGALPVCPEVGCGGRLTPDFNLGIATCSGKFNEDRGVFVKCYFKAKLEDVTGRKPWRMSEPTEEEKNEIMSSSRGIVNVSVVGSENLFNGIDMGLFEGRKQAIQILIVEARKKGIKIPTEESEAKVRIGAVLMSHVNSSPAIILNELANEFGTEAAAEAKKANSAMGTRCASNEGIVANLSELAQNYLQSGNIQASGAYRKAAAAVRALDYPIVDGKALKKAKNKVAGIGPKIADLIDKYLVTGSMTSYEKGGQDEVLEIDDDD